jgi:hypothetical protein
MKQNIIYLFCLMNISGSLIYSMEKGYLILNQDNAEYLIRATTRYLNVATTAPSYSPTHPLITAYNQLLSIADKCDSKSYIHKACNIAEHPTITPYLYVMYDTWNKDVACQNAFKTACNATARAYTSQPSQGLQTIAKQNWNTFCRTTALLIGDTVTKYSTFRCPNGCDPDESKHIENLLQLNMNANPEDASVYIAGVYSLFVFKQIREANSN